MDTDYQYLGVAGYYISVRYSAGICEIEAQFRWHKPWTEGDAVPIRYDPANPECNDRTGIWWIRNFALLALIGTISLIAYIRFGPWGA